jgi:DNA-binding transcriptional regulator LsrR (DeoR family)
LTRSRLNQALALLDEGKIDLEEDMWMLFDDYMAQTVIQRLSQVSVVGDICMPFFDVDGNALRGALMHVISIDLHCSKETLHRIGVAGGTANPAPF